MKKNIHPKYNFWVLVQCICWNSFEVNSAVEWPIKIESCPKCHSAYTKKQENKVIKGRMEKFMEKQKRIDNLKK